MSFNYITKQDKSKELFFKIPKQFLYEKTYKKMNDSAKILYSILYERTNLSIKNDWFDSNERAYIICTYDEMQVLFGCSRDKVSRCMKELEKYNLILKDKIKNKDGDMINVLYIAHAETTSETLESLIKQHKADYHSLRDKNRAYKRAYNKKQSELKKQKRENKVESENQTTIGNTTFQNLKLIKPSNFNGSLKTRLRVVRKSDYSKTYKSKTEYSMYVCNDKSQLKKSKLIEITKKYLCLSNNSEKELVKFDSKIDFDLFEKVLMKIINNNKINDKESYLIQTISNLIDKNIVTLDQYTKSIEEYNKKYIDKKQSNLNSNNKTKNIKPRTTQHAINQTYKKYNADELENMLLNNQKSKFDNVNRLTKKSINEKLANDNSSDQEEFEWDY